MRIHILNHGLRVMFFVLLAVPVMAEVSLNTSVQKVEIYLAENGEQQTRLVSADEIIPGDELKYVIEYSNEGDQPVDQGTIVITDPIPQSTKYVPGTAFGSGTNISFSVDGGDSFATEAELTVDRNGVELQASPEDYTTVRWIFGPMLEPGQTGHVSFNVVLK